MKTKKPLIKIAFFISFLVAVSMVALIFFAVYARYKVIGILDIGRGNSTSNDIVILEIGDKIFNIPKNYIWSREDWKGGKVDAINLQALLPDFEPYLDSNKAEFDKPGWNREITFVLNHHNTAGSRTGSQSMNRKDVYDRVIYDFVLRKKKDISESAGPYNLTLQTLNSANHSSDRELYVGRKKDGEFYWVDCSKDKPKRYPSCNTYLEYSDKVYVSYKFSKKYLVDWEKIDDAVFNFIEKFDVSVKKSNVGSGL